MREVAKGAGLGVAGRLVLVSLCVVAVGCQKQPASSFSFYEQRIAPIVDVGCQRQTTGCHVDDGHGFALGNLDLSSYDSLSRRADVLDAYGPYPVGVFLLKAGTPVHIDVRTIDPPDPMHPTQRRVGITTDVRHGGGEGAIAQGSRDYAILKQWIDGGHARTGVPQSVIRTSTGACVHGVGSAAGIDLSNPPQDPKSYARFVAQVQPMLTRRCAGSDCHGAQIADLYLSCGTSAAEQRWNYEVSVRYLDEVAASSELLRRPLAVSAGGAYHEGGDIFAGVDDPDYRLLLDWAQDLVKRAPHLLELGAADEGLRFFANRVEPVLVRKGCMFLNCHSPAMFHDLRLRSGSSGFFSSIAMQRNYDMSRNMLALDAPDPNQSRLIAKNLCPATVGGHGVQHRGGALFEDFGGCAKLQTQASAQQCASVDVDHGDLDKIPAYCVLAHWHDLERNLAIKRGELPATPPPAGVLFITRPDGVGGILDFETFRPGADLVLADASQNAQGELDLGATRSLLASCKLGAGLDLRGTAISWDATTIAFSARQSASDAWRIYQVKLDGTQCAPVPGLPAKSAEQNGITIHDFDPAYAPDGRIVFASTRGNLDGGTDYRGPTLTPASLAPNANIYIYDPKTSSVRQLTYLLNQELAPSFLSDGRAIFTTEKRALDFHQLAARRINLDGGDYHPLIAQRSSIGFASGTEVVELPNRNLALVAGPLDAVDGGGSIVVVNRSIGPDQHDRDPHDRGYVHSLTTPTPGVFGGDTGVFRSPAPLPSGRLLAACDLGATDLTRGPRHYGLCELDSVPGGSPRMLWQSAQQSALEPMAVWPRFARPVFRSRSDETNGHTRIEPGQDDAIIHFKDLPMLATLLFSNTRIGRPIPQAMRAVSLFESRPPPSNARSFSTLGKGVVSDKFGQFFQDLRPIGTADLHADGSLQVRIAGGMPFSVEAADASGKALVFGKGAPFTGPILQREELQFYPGERSQQSMPRRLFNGVCAGCHGSLTGRELDVVVNVDVLTSASKTLADDDLLDLR
ncbi:MAG TPA: hypothetical protein VF331_24145 [Polyangiales bacterium]